MDSMVQCMEKYRLGLIKRCEDGLKGTVQVEVKTLNIGLTNQCNIHCIMCPYISKDTKNRTYYGEEPCMMTLRQFKRVLGVGLFASLQQNERPISFHFMKGETFLNPYLMDILKFIKKRYPNSEVTVLSNGTIPPKDPEIVKYIDILGFSLDGGTKEVFEMIRTPSRYDHVVDIVRKWVRARNQYNPNLCLRTSTTLSTLNMADLPNILRLVRNIAEEEGSSWDSIYCQPVIIEDYQPKELREITLEHFDREAGMKAWEETLQLSRQYSIRIDAPEVLYKMFSRGSHGESPQELNDEMIDCPEIFCLQLENGILSYDFKGRIEYACCFMDKKYQRELIERYGIPDKKRPEKIYNCLGYWKMRKDLLEGKLKKECRDCTIGRSNYFTLYERLKPQAAQED